MDAAGLFDLGGRVALVSGMFQPYIVQLQRAEGCYGAGLGFELSPPAGLDEEAPREAGVALVFLRDSVTGTWARRELLPLVGHGYRI